MTEKLVEEIAEKVLKQVTTKITDIIANSFYSEMQDYLVEHFTNVDRAAREKLIREISENFVQNPSEYKYANLRNQLFKENKKVILEKLTDEAITKNIEKVIFGYVSPDYYFNWQWTDALIKFIDGNISKFTDNSEFHKSLLNQLAVKDRQIQYLTERMELLEKD